MLIEAGTALNYKKLNRLMPLAALGIVLVTTQNRAAAATITFSGGSVIETHYESDDVTPIAPDSGFFFELGTFAPGFDPTTASTDQWLANWTAVTDAGGVPLASATTEFTTYISDLFGPYVGYNSEVNLDHNNPPFTTTQQGYVWGFDTRTDPGAAQWVLITNSNDWLFPNASGGIGGGSLSVIWDIAAADEDETLVGTIVYGGGIPTMTLGDVTIPGPVPEPGTATLLLLAASVAATRRRR